MTLESISKYYVLLPLMAVFALSCSSQDVRMGMAGSEGARLSYRTVGQGEVLVVIHDGPGGEKSIMYDGFDDLSANLRVIYYDQRGCGRSEPLGASQSCTIEDNVEDLEALRSYLHVKRFSIAAHGWGAVIAVEYARKHPEYVDAIVLITPVSPMLPAFISKTSWEGCRRKVSAMSRRCSTIPSPLCSRSGSSSCGPSCRCCSTMRGSGSAWTSTA
jgi:pimeloyl-ACP methyl ester carboxylesterase